MIKTERASSYLRAHLPVANVMHKGHSTHTNTPTRLLEIPGKFYVILECIYSSARITHSPPSVWGFHFILHAQ